MKAWLKGGLIALGIDFLIFLVWWLYAVVYIVVLDRGSDMSWLALGVIPYYFLLSVVPVFIVGIIIAPEFIVFSKIADACFPNRSSSIKYHTRE